MNTILSYIRRNISVLVILVASLVYMSSCSKPTPPPTPSQAHLFFDQLKELCGNTYFGEVVTPLSEDDTFYGKSLTMTVKSCSETEIRIPFWVGQDSSRTWIFTLTNEKILFKHDHRKKDGTPDEITNYGGLSDSTGNIYSQRFPADEETAELIPAAKTNAWTVTIDKEKNELLYLLERNNKERFRARFFLK